MGVQHVHTFSGLNTPLRKRRFLLDGQMCEALYVSRWLHGEDCRQAGPSTQPSSSRHKSYETYRETLPEDLDFDRPSASSHSGVLPRLDIPLGWDIVVRNGLYDEVFLIQSSIPFFQAYQELCEAMERLTLEKGGDEEPHEAEVDEIRTALGKLSFVEPCAHEEVGEATLVEWEDSDSETMVAEEEPRFTGRIDEIEKARKPQLGRKSAEDMEHAVRDFVMAKRIHAETFQSARPPPHPTGLWVLDAMCKVGLECKAYTVPPSYRTLVAPVFQNLIKSA